MEKKYFYVDNLHKYGKRLYKKKLPEDWIFANLSEDVYCLYNEKTRKIVMSKKHPKDKPDIYIAFAICYHKYMGWAEPKEKSKMKRKIARDLKIEELFFSVDDMRRLKICCGYGRNGDILYEFAKENNGNIFRLKPTTIVYVYKKEN